MRLNNAPNAIAKRGSVHSALDLLLSIYKCEDGLRDVSSSFSHRILPGLTSVSLMR